MFLAPRLVIAFVVGASLAAPAGGVPISPGNLVISQENVLYEITRDGTIVQTISVPHPAGPRPLPEYVRDVAIDRDGNLVVYNGTYDAYVSTYDVDTESWSHQTAEGFGSAMSLSVGRVAPFGDIVFATDHDISMGYGIYAFDRGAGTSGSFAGDLTIGDITLGWDGLLYVLERGGSTYQHTLRIYDPATLAVVNELDLEPILGLGTDHRALTASAAGEIFIAGWDGEIWQLDGAGDLVANQTIPCTYNTVCRFNDVNLGFDGLLVTGTRDREIIIIDPSDWSTSGLEHGNPGDGLFVAVAVPEPSAGCMVLLGALMAAALRRRTIMPKNRRLWR